MLLDGARIFHQIVKMSAIQIVTIQYNVKLK